MNNTPNQPQHRIPVENTPALPSILTPQEQSVMNGAIRQKAANATTGAGAILGGAAGAIIGGIWAFVSRKGSTGIRTAFKVAGAAGVVAAIGAVASRFTWGKSVGEKTVHQVNEQLAQLPPEQQAMAYQQIGQQLKIQDPNAPFNRVMANTAQVEAVQATEPALQR